MSKSGNKKPTNGPRGRANLAALMRQRIIDSIYAPGTQLPPRLALAQDLDASSHTIQAALDRLTADGFLESRPRIGTFVTARPPHTHVYALTMVESVEGTNHLDNTRFPALLIEAAKTMSLPDGKSIRVYEGVDNRTLAEPFHRLRADLHNQCLAGVIATNAMHVNNLAAESRVPWVAASSDDTASDWLSLEFSQERWAAHAADYLRKQGHKRVACLFNGGREPDSAEKIADILRARGLDVPRRLMQGVSPHARQWARRSVELMLTPSGTPGPAARRAPDALLVCDDILLESAMGGVIDAGLIAPDDLEVVSLANFPSAKPSLFPVTRLGLDLRQFILTAIDLIDRKKAGLEVPALTRLPAYFEADLPKAASSFCLPIQQITSSAPATSFPSR